MGDVQKIVNFVSGFSYGMPPLASGGRISSIPLPERSKARAYCLSKVNLVAHIKLPEGSEC